MLGHDDNSVLNSRLYAQIEVEMLSLISKSHTLFIFLCH